MYNIWSNVKLIIPMHVSDSSSVILNRKLRPSNRSTN